MCIKRQIVIHFSTPIQNMFIDPANSAVFTYIVTASIINVREKLVSKPHCQMRKNWCMLNAVIRRQRAVTTAQVYL